MTKSLTRITQELDRQLAQFQQLQTQLDGVYADYLTQLGGGLRRQLVMAAYQVCTRHYPEDFLKLSYRDRTDLQQQLQQLGYQKAQTLPGILQQPYSLESSKVKQGLRAELLKRLPITPEQLQMIKDKLLQKAKPTEDNADLPQDAESDADSSDSPEPIVIALDSEQLQAMFEDEDELDEDDNPTVESESDSTSQGLKFPEMMAQLAAIAQQSLASELQDAEDGEAAEAKDEEDNSPLEAEAASNNNDAIATDEEPDPDGEPTVTEADAVFVAPTNPVDYLRWCQHLEERIQDSLKALSMQANQALQAKEILSSKFPDKLFQAAIEADEGGNNLNAAPNTMNIIVETDLAPRADSEKTTVMPITVIRLRLAEVEFAETAVSALRSQLRERLAQMKSLATTYRKLQKEQATAEAETAWRSAWYEAEEPRTETD